MSETTTTDIQVVKDAVGYMPVRPFVWPKTWAAVKMETLDAKGHQLRLPNGELATEWTAAFVVYTAEGKRAPIDVPDLTGKVPRGTTVDEIHTHAVDMCHEVLRRMGAVDGVPG